MINLLPYFTCTPIIEITKTLKIFHKSHDFFGGIIIDIEIKKRNSLKDFCHQAHSKLEDILFSIITKLPESVIPHSLMDWMGYYTDKRIAELTQQIIHNRWKSIALDRAVDIIHIRQQDKKQAPSEE